MREWITRVSFVVAAVSAVGCDGGNIDGNAGSGGNGDASVNPTTCERDEDCDDGLHCNGAERCAEQLCVPGTAPICDDGIDCTIDGCSEEQGGCHAVAADEDGDGHRDATCVDGLGDPLGDDCDDADSTRYPGAFEICDADDHDEDCDLSSFGRVDADGDGYLNGNCCNVQDDGTATCGNDCDDANARMHPQNTETCDGLDNDCNGLLDHPTEDQDGDGYATSACGGTDCDDFDPLTYAGAAELCDGKDNDCLQGGGSVADEADLDADAFVSAVCKHVADTSMSPGECDDDRRTANPGQPELCNGRDDDCDGEIDEALDCAGAVRAVDAGYLQTCVVRVDGSVACWGRNDDGALGTGADDWVLEYPRDVLDPREVSLRLSQVSQVAIGWYHGCAVHQDGRLSCWGNNGAGALGAGIEQSGVAPPVAVSGIEDASDVCAGNGFSCALRADGSVWCWGSNGYGQLGVDDTDPSTVPVRVTGLPPSSDIDCDGFFACSTSTTGKVHCWGDNRHGQLGDITTTEHHLAVQAIGVDGAVKVSTSRSHACAQLGSGRVMCWGDNTFGQLGHGATGGDVLRAAEVLQHTGLPLVDVVELSAGGGDPYYDTLLDDAGNTCARVRDGRVLCWGRNHRGQLGYGAWENSGVVPARLDGPRYAVQELPDALQLAVGHQHGCAIAPDGSLRCWGGGEGQLPDFASSPTPILIEGL